MSPADALARAVAMADLRVVRGASALPVGAFGPLRAIARWRVASALQRAASELGLTLPDDRERPHVTDADPVGATVALLQTAWLRLHRIVLPPSLGLRVTTHERYWAELDKRALHAPHARKWIVVGVTAVALGGAIALVVNATSRDAPAPLPLHVGPMLELPLDREEVWVDALSDWVVALDKLTHARHDGDLPSIIDEKLHDLALCRKAALSDELRPLFGDDVMTALGAMLDAAEGAARGEDGWSDREDAFAEAVRTTNRALLARGYGYFFDSYSVRFDDGRAEAAFYTFRIASRRRFAVGDSTIEALHLRRIDRLNIVQQLLGYTSKRMDVAVLLVDKLESEVATRLGPALEPGHEMPLHMDPDDEGKTSWLAVRQKAGQVVRETYYGAFHGEQQALSEIGELLARRNDLVIDWNSRLAGRDVTLRDFESLDVDAEYRDRFQALTSLEARKVLDDIQKKLETDEERLLFERLVARHARPVELHEVQHRIDYASGDDFKVPDALLAAMHIPSGSDDADRDEIRRIAYELSAYTAELARDPEWARVNLTLLCEHLYDGSGGAEGWSAVMILEGLASELGLAFDRLLATGNGADLETVAAIHLKLLGQSGPDLASAAGRLWQKWFGHPLVTMTPIE